MESERAGVPGIGGQEFSFARYGVVMPDCTADSVTRLLATEGFDELWEKAQEVRVIHRPKCSPKCSCKPQDYEKVFSAGRDLIIGIDFSASDDLTGACLMRGKEVLAVLTRAGKLSEEEIKAELLKAAGCSCGPYQGCEVCGKYCGGKPF